MIDGHCQPSAYKQFILIQNLNVKSKQNDLQTKGSSQILKSGQ